MPYLEKDYVGNRVTISGSRFVIRGINSVLIHVGSAEKLTNADLKWFVNLCSQVKELSDPYLLLPLYLKKRKNESVLKPSEIWSEIANKLLTNKLEGEDINPRKRDEMKAQVSLGIGTLSGVIEDFLNQKRPIEDFDFEFRYPNVPELIPLGVGFKPVKSICSFTGFSKRWYKTVLQVIRIAQKANTPYKEVILLNKYERQNG